MADFQFKPLTHSPERLNVITTKLGVRGQALYSDADVYKAVKMSDNGTHVLCADGDEIEGFIDNIDAGPTANLQAVGGVARGGEGFRVEAQVAAGATPLVWGDRVVAGAQVAVGTKNLGNTGLKALAQVKAGEPTEFIYRVINLYTGNGAPGSTVLLEKL